MLKTFTNDYLGEIDVIIIDNKPYFDGTKVAKILGYSNPHAALSRHCKDTGLTFREVGVATGKRKDGSEVIQKVSKIFISEGNVYRLIIKSKKPQAIIFEKWVMDEVLPSIRNNGEYNYSEKYIQNLISICTTQQNNIEKLIEDKQKSKPYIDIAKTVISSDDSISIGAFAKLLNSLGIDIGRNRLFNWFRVNGYIMKQGKENQPKQIYIDKGLFTTRQYTVNTKEGSKINITPYITTKGQAYFIEKINRGKDDLWIC